MKLKVLIISILCSFMSLAASAQALRGSYFSEYSVFRTKLNPAFVPRAGYLGFAAIDNLGLGITSNVGMSTFLYPSADGQSTLTFLHPDVPAATFMKKLPAVSYLDADVDTDILNIGFYTGKNSFWTFGIGVRADAEVNIPGELFSFMKQGGAEGYEHFSIKNLSLIQNTYIEASLGYAHNMSDIVKGLSVGGRVKFLAAADRVDARIKRLDLTMGEDKWSVESDVEANVMATFLNLDVTKKENGTPSFQHSFDLTKIGLAGMGAAFDLGAEYRLPVGKFFDSIRFSASVTDLGFMSYPTDAVQRFTSAGQFDYDGFDISFGEDQNFDKMLEELQNEFMQLLNLEETAPASVVSRTKPTLHLGVEMPFLWNKMSLGLLYSARFGYTSTRNELTLALNMRPAKWFNFGVNYSFLNAAKSIGWILEFISRSGVNFFIGSDYTFLEVNPQYIPVNQVNFNLRTGLSFSLGNKYDEVAQARRDARQARRN